MKKNIYRHEQQYIDIEDFKDYELTNCISFEMAIRNKEALRLATDITLLQFYSISNYINLFIDNKHSIIHTSKVTGLSIDTLKLIKLNCTKKYTFKTLADNDIDKLYDVMDNNKDDNELSWITEESDTYDITSIINQLKNSLENKFFIVAPFIKNLLEEYNFSILKDTTMFKFISIIDEENEDMEPFFNNQKSLDHGSKIREGIFISSSTTEVDCEYNEQEYQCFFDTRKTSKEEIETHLTKDNLKTTHDITPYLSRPILKVPNKICKNVTLHDINLSLSNEELSKYILHIQKHFLKDHTIITTPSEILGEEISYTDKTIKRDKSKTMQEKFSDMLYIYDALKIGMKKSNIQREIVTYYSNKYIHKFTPNMDYSTINNYYKIATEYIEELKYKTLISAD